MFSLDEMENAVRAGFSRSDLPLTANLKGLRNLGCSAYSRCLDDAAYLDGLIYLPGAMAMLLSEHCAGIQRERLRESVCWYLRGWMLQLRNDGIINFVRDAWMEILQSYSGNTPTIEHLSRTRMAEPSCLTDSLDAELNALLDPQLERDNKTFHEIISHWMSVMSAEHSMTVIDFLLRVKLTTSTWQLYSEQKIKDVAFSGETRTLHMHNCESALVSRFGGNMIQIVKSILLP
jgi:hypothetical protein